MDIRKLIDKSRHDKSLAENTLLVTVKKASESVSSCQTLCFKKRRRSLGTHEANMAMKKACLLSIKALMPFLPVICCLRRAAAPTVAELCTMLLCMTVAV